MIHHIRPDLSRIEVPLPGNPLQSINSYVVRSNDRNLVIDTGMLRPECEEALRAGLKHLKVEFDRTDFFITHLHADHLGLVTELATEKSTVFFSEPDAVLTEGYAKKSAEAIERLTTSAARLGFSTQEIEEALRKHPGIKYIPKEFPPFTFLQDGERLEVGNYTFQVVDTPGHSPGHQCLYEANHRLLVSGDHILGDITPNITIWKENDDALGDYLASLDKVSHLDVDLVLPGHRRPFSDCTGRIAELKRHHEDRLSEVMDAIQKEPRSVYEIASEMSWDIVADNWQRFPIVQKWFAVNEAASHVRYLEHRGQLKKQDTADVIHYIAD